jgi:hypothetical protein
VKDERQLFLAKLKMRKMRWLLLAHGPFLIQQPLWWALAKPPGFFFASGDRADPLLLRIGARKRDRSEEDPLRLGRACASSPPVMKPSRRRKEETQLKNKCN